MDINELEKWVESGEGSTWLEAKKAPLLSKRDELLATLREVNGRLSESTQRAADVEKLLSDEREATRKVIVDDALTRKLKESRVMEHAIPGLVTELKQVYDLTMKTYGSSREAIGKIRGADGTEQEASLDDIVEAWASRPEAKYAIKAPLASGGGALGGASTSSDGYNTDQDYMKAKFQRLNS